MHVELYSEICTLSHGIQVCFWSLVGRSCGHLVGSSVRIQTVGRCRTKERALFRPCRVRNRDDPHRRVSKFMNVFLEALHLHARSVWHYQSQLVQHHFSVLLKTTNTRMASERHDSPSPTLVQDGSQVSMDSTYSGQFSLFADDSHSGSSSTAIDHLESVAFVTLDGQEEVPQASSIAIGSDGLPILRAPAPTPPTSHTSNGMQHLHSEVDQGSRVSNDIDLHFDGSPLEIEIDSSANSLHRAVSTMLPPAGGVNSSFHCPTEINSSIDGSPDSTGTDETHVSIHPDRSVIVDLNRRVQLLIRWPDTVDPQTLYENTLLDADNLIGNASVTNIARAEGYMTSRNTHGQFVPLRTHGLGIEGLGAPALERRSSVEVLTSATDLVGHRSPSHEQPSRLPQQRRIIAVLTDDEGSDAGVQSQTR